MTGNPRLARTFAAIALLSGIAAAWLVSDYTGTVERRAGRSVRTFVAARAIERGETVSSEMLAQRSVPQAYVPADAITGLDSLEGARAAADIGSGAYLTEPLFVTGSATGPGYKLRRSERAVTIDAKVSPDGATVQAGAIVDVFASGFGGATETVLVLAGAETLAAEESSSGQSQQRLTLRVGVAQAPSLIKGDVFARELRAVVRP